MDNVLDVVRDAESIECFDTESEIAGKQEQNDLLVHLCSSIFILDEFDIDDKY